MAKVRIKNVSPLGDLWVLGHTVKAGDTIEVDAEQAGKEPGEFKPAHRSIDGRHVRKDKDGNEHPIPAGLSRQAVDDDGTVTVEEYDPGYGLLAQVGTWERVKGNAPDKKD